MDSERSASRYRTIIMKLKQQIEDYDIGGRCANCKEYYDKNRIGMWLCEYEENNERVVEPFQLCYSCSNNMYGDTSIPSFFKRFIICFAILFITFTAAGVVADFLMTILL